MSAAQLRDLQNQAVDQAIANQEARGLALVTDGELRRVPLLSTPTATPTATSEPWSRGWSRSLTRQTHDEELSLVSDAVTTRRRERPAGITPSSTGAGEADAFAHNAALEEYRYARRITERPVKICLLGPERAAQGFDTSAARSAGGFEQRLAEVVDVERQVIAELVEDGCPYIQLDVPGYSAYEDPTGWAALRGRGADPLVELQLSIQADNAVIAGLDSVTCGLHLCRRGDQGRWQRAARNDAVAERLFDLLAFDRILVDYGDAETSRLDQLRFVPPGKTVVLGLVSTRHERVESSDELVRRVDEASQYIDVDQLAIGPQCGFAGPVGGRDITESAQWRKLDRLLEAAARVWP
jgi:5-methyltetrahydropteroyltriglutamate--homocysteine methyltransferase